MRKFKKQLLMAAMVSLTLSLSACGNTDKKSEKSGDSQTAQTEATDTPAPEATATAEPEKKEIEVNKTFVSKSKKKNLYQASRKEAKNAKSASSLKSWEKGGIKQQIVDFVNQATDKKSDSYVPPEDRIVVTDIDGTLIAEKGKKVDNDAMVKLTPAEVKDHVLDIQEEYFDEDKKLLYSAILYQPMLEMYDYLKANEFDIYFVSGNCNALTYAWANYYFGADYAHSIGSNITLEFDETDGFKMGPTGAYEGCWNEVKSYRIYNQIGKCPVLAFGNSDGDVQMLEWIQTNPDYESLSVMINHDDDREYVYSVDSISGFCEKYGFIDAKISENFKTVFIK